MKKNSKLRLETLAIHGKTDVGERKGGNPVVPPIVNSTIFFDSPERSEDDYHYTRSANPNRDQLEALIAALENGTDCAMFSSGMAATSAVFQSMKPNSHVLIPNDVYHGTRRFLKEVMAPKGMLISEVDMTDTGKLLSALRADTRLVWLESPSNPRLLITDIRAITKIAGDHNFITVVDNTWPSPINQRPIELGADLVVHSATKYLGGHSDILAGAVVAGSQDIFKKVREIQSVAGAVPSAADCWLLARSIKTLPARMRIHNESAVMIARFLNEHPKVEKVYFPGLPDHPGHETAKNQMVAFGGMISFLVKGDTEKAKEVVYSSQIIAAATSLGGVESTWEHRRSSEGPESPTPPNLIRLSVGLEHPVDLISDIENALTQS